MNVRKAELKDVDNNLLNLYIDGFKYHYEARKDIFKNRTDEELKESLVDNIDNIVIIEDEIILGYAIYKIKESQTKSIWIDQLIIDEKYRKQGLGKKLIEYVQTIGVENNCNRLEFSCWTFNTNALEVYKHLGFLEQRIIFEKEL